MGVTSSESVDLDTSRSPELRPTAGAGPRAPDGGVPARRVPAATTSIATRAALAASVIVAVACGAGDDDPTAVEPSTTATVDHGGAVARDPDVPELPFDDNPDPSACGMPMPWGDDDPAWLTGEWDGELIQPDVLLYDSHLRRSIVGQAPHGAQVTVVLYQQNPTLDYYLVESIDDPTQEGWVPAPFLAFDPVG